MKRNDVEHAASIGEGLECANCHHKYGYYESLGPRYTFKCLYCGIERRATEDKHATAVLEIVRGDKKAKFVIYRDNQPISDIITQTLRHRYAIISATLRQITPHGIISHPILRKTLVRTSIARARAIYDAVGSFVNNYIRWTINDKKKK